MVDDLRLFNDEPGRYDVLWMRVSAGSRGNLRPETVLTGLGVEVEYADVERVNLLFEFDTN
jgi:hypothetical protein